MAVLSKSRSVLEREPNWRDCGDETVWFESVNEDTDLVDRSITFSIKDWVDMGSPETITITIEPGDRLNDEE